MPDTPTIRTFVVSPDVPASLQPLLELAHNLWWVWNPDAVDLFHRLDRELWEKVYHNPVKLLGSISQDKLLAAASDEGFLARLERVHEDFRNHLNDNLWFQKKHSNSADLRVAYFSAEFGLHESLPIYSGGLGILAGDHLKSASELGLPLTAVGLLYRNGYFQQYLSADGWQQEAYPELDFYNLPIEQIKSQDGSPLTIRIDLPDNSVFCNVWRVNVGRIPLYLLDTNLPENSPTDRDITCRLYGAGTELRIKQEIVLGIGGTRALAAMGININVFHMNEGHSAFLALERIRVMLAERPNLTFDQARQVIMASSVFTTHTPVPAGIDHFTSELMTKYFKSLVPQLKLDEEGFLALGRENVFEKKQGFSMAVLAIRLADGVNGVSWLHGVVSRQMWHSMWPAVPSDEVPIGHVTNGIHLRSWLSPEIAFVLDRYLPEGWQTNQSSERVWQDVSNIPDEELWRAHERCRERLVTWTRQALREQLTRRGATFADLAVADEVLDPEALTIGFARRFATYKRGALLLRDADRLKRLLEDSKRPVQFIFAGKAHPADQDGKELIRTIVNFARDAGVRRKFVFVENYDINVARYLVQGVDVWLNTPRRPHEASGTSGMKAAVNGVPNCSILDGWWVEGFAIDPAVGWAIGRGELYPDSNYQDTLESQSLYDLIETQIQPLFYNRGADKIPRGWIARMKASIARLTPVFNTNRQVSDYTEKFYLPGLQRGASLVADNLARAIKLAKTKDTLRQKWNSIQIVAVQSSGNGHFKVGESMQVEAMVDLNDVDPAELSVQLFAGPLNATGQIERPRGKPMQLAKQLAPGRFLYTGAIECKSSGRHGYAVRVLPGDADFATPFEPGLIRWN